MHYCTTLLGYCGVAGDWEKVSVFTAIGNICFNVQRQRQRFNVKQFHNTLRVKRLSSVWNGLRVMELANDLFYIGLYHCQEQVSLGI